MMMVLYWTVEYEIMEAAPCFIRDQIIADGDNNMMFDAIPSELFQPKTSLPYPKPMSFTDANFASEIAFYMGLISHLTLILIEDPRVFSGASFSFVVNPIVWPS